MKLNFTLFLKSFGLALFLILSFHQKMMAQKYFQMSEEQFGKTNLQFKTFNWKTIKTNNFEFNFYQGGEGLAKRAAQYAESELPKITSTIGYAPFSNIKVFIFNSKDELDQTNIGLVFAADIDQKTENLSKSRILVPFQKNDSIFKKTLIKEISNLYLFEMLYSGTLKEMAQNQLLLSVPEWFSSGITSFIAESDNSAQFEKFRSKIISLKNTKLANLKGESATIIGQSIWNYISVKYGQDNISNIVNLTRIIRNEQAAITSSLGVPFVRFLKDWKAFYVDNAGLVAEEKRDLLVSKSMKTEKVVNRLSDLKPGEIDTDNYEFNPTNLIKYANATPIKEANESGPVSILNNGTNKEIKLSPTKAFKNSLLKANSNYGIKFDPIRKFGLTGSLVLNDMLENNVFTFTGYLRASTPLFKNFDYAMEYANYTKKIDWKLKFEKRSFNMSNIDNGNSFVLSPLGQNYADSLTVFTTRIVYQKLNATFSYPIRKNLKIDLSPSIIKTTLVDYDLQANDNQNNYYINESVSLIFDNSIQKSLQSYLGTKIKLSLENNACINNKSENFKRINFDARHYHKLAQGLVFAARFNYGNSTGNAPKYSFLGGVENGFFRTVYQNQNIFSGPIKDYRNILFYNFPGNLRGFDFARIYGTNYMLTNLEIRFTLAESMPQLTAGSTFLSNLQLVLFNDIGTSWNGNNGPFSSHNSLNSTNVGSTSDAFFATVRTFKNPFLIGLGAGLRTLIFGLPIKIDYGFGLQDKVLNPGKLQVSLGKNF